MTMPMSMAIPSVGWIGPLHRITIGNHLASLILEQVDRVRGMMPEQMIGPAARLAGRIRVGATEEVGLHVHLQNLELALLHPLVNPLVARVEPPHVSRHAVDAGLLGDLSQLLGVRDAVGDRDFDQHVFAGAHHLFALAKVHLRRRGEDHGVSAFDAFGQIAGEVRDAVFLGDLSGCILVAADEGGHLDVRNALEGVEMFLTKGALAGDANFHDQPLRTSALTRAAARLSLRSCLPAALRLFSRMMCPTAVLEAGTV